MKKIFLPFLFITLFLSVLFAVPVSKSKSRKVLYNFLKYKNVTSYKVESEINLNDGKTNLGYIYQLSPKGFVVISSDDEIAPILAYSFKNKLITENDNLIYRMLITDVKFRLEHSPENLKEFAKKEWELYLTNSKENRDFQQWPAEGCTQTDGWVETTWRQSGVYNRFCPLDGPNSRSVVGCVATAMCMIIDYHHYVGNVQFSDADDYISGWDNQMHIDDDYQERDYPSFPELNQYLITLKEHYENGVPLTDDDKSALCFAGGISTHMIYGAEGSGTWVSEVQTALLNKFGFSSADYVDNINNQFYSDLADNMKNMKPAELAIYTSGWNSGHAIICDGYNTDNYYHLNYGWGTSDNTCWYLLPEGMPYNYSIIANAVINIEGGDIPTHISGNVSLNGETPQGVYIRLEGNKIYEAYVTSQNGNYEIPAVEAGDYLATAIKQGNNLYYQEFEISVSGENQIINFELSQYSGLSITIQSPVNPVGTNIQLFKNDELAYSGICQNQDGTLSIPNVLPGDYTAKASLSDNYFGITNFSVTPTNQSLNISLSEYGNIFKIGYHNYSSDRWFLADNYTIGCGIKLTPDIYLNYENVPVAGVRFKSPISSDEGQVIIQLWEQNTLIEQKELENFEADEWVLGTFDNFYILNPEKSYFIGYKITSENGYFAYYDNGPRVSGKGAFFKASSWNEIPIGVLDANFCIEALFISQNASYISGIVNTTDNYQNLERGIVKANNYITNCNFDGTYQIALTQGNYDVSAYLPEHIASTIPNVVVGENANVQNINFLLEYGTYSVNQDIEPVTNNSVKVYPNPFVMRNNSKSNLVFYLQGEFDNPKIEIFNLKGQLLYTVKNLESNKIVWNLDNKNIPSGLYFYRVSDNSSNTVINKFLILK